MTAKFRRKSVEEYIEAGLIHTLQPKRWGGYEHDHEVAFDIAIELGKSTCASSAWVLNYLADHACILAHFPEEAQHDVWSENKAACIATSAAPTGKVTVVPAAIGSTAAGRGAAGCVIRSGSCSAVLRSGRARTIPTCGFIWCRCRR